MTYIMLKDVCSINMGQSPNSNSYNDIGDGVPFFQGNADFGERYPITRKWCSAPTKMAAPEDILISVRAPIGAMNYAKEECCIGRGLAALTPNTTKVFPSFIFWLLKGKTEELNSKGTGSTFKAIGRKVLEETLVPDLSLEEQKKCAEVLEKIYAVIQNRKQELQKLDDLIKAQFVEMFGDPVDNPMEWDVKQLQEIVASNCTVSYGIVQTGEDQIDGVPVFRPVDIVNRIPRYSELKRTTKEISDKYRRTILKGREMLITVRANIADTCIVGEEFAGCNVGRGIVPIRTQEDVISLEFLKYQIDNKHLNDEIKKLAKGITLIQLNMEDLREVSLIVPPIDKQISFVKMAEQIDKSKFAVQKALDKAQLLFDSLMQKYFG